MKIHPLLLKRQSRRAIDPGRPLPAEVVESLIEAFRWAPSSGNAQPWRLILLEEEEAKRRLSAALSPGNQAWAPRAPLLMVVACDMFEQPSRNGWSQAILSCGLALENLLLQGTHLGLVIHAMAGWDEAGVREAVGLPEGLDVVCLVAVGYPGKLDELDEETQRKEKAPRVRKDPKTFVHRNRWGG
ncbi:MAG: nitroreductase family protein [Nitrospinota bacterium]